MKEVKDFLNLVSNHLFYVSDNISYDKTQKFIELIRDAINTSHSIFIFGAGRSGLVGKAFAMRLMHLNLNVYFVGDVTTPSMTKDDLLVLISGSGNTNIVVEVAKTAKKNIGSNKIVLVTVNANSKIGRMADIIIELPNPPNNDYSYYNNQTNSRLIDNYLERQIRGCNTSAPMGTIFELSASFVLDALIAKLMADFNKTENDLKERHDNLL